MAASRIAKIVITIVVVAFVIIIGFRFMSMRGNVPAKSIDEIQAEEGIPVDVAVVGTSSISRNLELMGYVQGYEQVEITSSLPIDITRIVKREGNRVKKGDVVIQLARGRIGNAYHQFAMAEQALENAKNDLRRFENLYKEGAVSAQMLEQARLAHKNAKAQYDQALSMVDLVTPIDGVVTKVDATEGDAAAPGVPLMTIATVGKVRVRCDVGQDEIGLLKPGQPVRIRLTTVEETGWDQKSSEVEGVVGSVSLSADSETKLFMTEVVAENPDGILKPGMIAAVSVTVQKKENIITVPATALIQREAGWFVYLVSKGKAEFTPVDIGVSDGRMTEVRTNLSTGDSLVVRGQFKLSDGIMVKIREVTPTPTRDMARE